MKQAKVIISKTTVYVTGYSKNGATIIFQEDHNSPAEYAYNSDAVLRSKAVAFDYANSTIIQENATRDQVLDGLFNNRF